MSKNGRNLLSKLSEAIQVGLVVFSNLNSFDTNKIKSLEDLYLRKSNSSINYVTRPTIQDKASHKRSAYSVGKTFDSVSISVCRGDL